MAKKNYPFFEIETRDSFTSGISTNPDWEPITNILETENSVIIEMELPGVIRENISIYLEDNRELIVKGVKKQPDTEGLETTFYLFERKFGSFHRRIFIDIPIDGEKINSYIENGVLIIEIQKKSIDKISVNIK